jgi:HNH endonuclease
MSTEIRCTYCLDRKPLSSFEQRGDHVIPASLGGRWIDAQVCDDCNEVANLAADQLIANDVLVRFLRDAYRIRDRHGLPPPCEFSVRMAEGGVVKVTLDGEGATFAAGMSQMTMRSLGLSHAADQPALASLVAQALGLDVSAVLQPIGLARAAQQFAARSTPPAAWSRFMAKLALAAGRDAYGDTWLDSTQASILSADVLGSEKPRFGQRTHYPPVEPVWPYEPPKHQMWIEHRDSTATLTIVLFGQVIGAVPVSDVPPPQGAYSAWTLDPEARAFRRSSYPAVWHGTAAARLTKAGYNVVSVLNEDPERSFLYVADGPDGPADLPIPTIRVDSPLHALELVHAKDRVADD